MVHLFRCDRSSQHACCGRESILVRFRPAIFRNVEEKFRPIRGYAKLLNVINLSESVQ